MDQRSLDEWLGYIESLHSSEIEFGLKRVKEVYSRLFPNGFSPTVVTVAGTNGKGTTCAYIESLLLELGLLMSKVFNLAIILLFVRLKRLSLRELEHS